MLGWYGTGVMKPVASKEPFQEWLCWLDCGLPVDTGGSAGAMAKNVVEPDAADELCENYRDLD